jgi:hypothetical protein
MNEDLIYTGIRALDIGDEDEVRLAEGLTLVKPNAFLLSGRMRYAQNGFEFEEAEKVSRYIVFRYKHDPAADWTLTKEPNAMFNGGLMALQIAKPVSTLGFIYRGTDYGRPTIYAAIEALPPMRAPEWARLKRFDTACLTQAAALVPRVQAALTGSSIPEKNAITTLQLGLETYSYHPYIAGLLWVMGMEAIFDSQNRHDFNDKLCRLLGPDTLAFPDWTDLVGPPAWTVEDVAMDLYMLRNKLAHGVDLRSAASDKTTPVDLLNVVQLHEDSGGRYYSTVLAEVACYLLCRVIQTVI